MAEGREAAAGAMRSLLEEAAAWRLLGLLLEYPTPAWRAQLEALLADFDGNEWRNLGEAALEGASEGVYLEVFGPDGVASPREAAHAGGIQLGHLLAELAGYYQAFGYRPAAAEPDDHIAVEAGFVAYLKMKQAFALACGDGEHADIAAQAATVFLRDHVAVTAHPLAAKLSGRAPEYLARAARLLAERAGPPPAHPFASAPGPETGVEDNVLECGAA